MIESLALAVEHLEIIGQRAAHHARSRAYRVKSGRVERGTQRARGTIETECGKVGRSRHSTGLVSSKGNDGPGES